MYIKQIYTNCLAHAAYYIEAGKEVAVVDPLRNPEPYLELAKSRGAQIKYVLETHFHADFVSGHIDLANESGATIVFGPGATPGYKAYVAEDGEMLQLGNAHIKVLHTPGHTVESSCFLLLNEDGKEQAIFTGDTLFVGDVGRPDLLSGNLSKEELASRLYDSLQTKIKTLPDELIVYPGHGAGSACGKNIGVESFSTIGAEKLNNYALRFADKDEFIAAVTSDLPYVPGYFFTDAGLNKAGASSYKEMKSKALTPLSIDQFRQAQAAGSVVLDTRDPQHFAAGFVPGAINVGLNGDFAVWVGSVVSPKADIILVVDKGREEEAVERLARIGYDHITGFLEGGMHAWFAEGIAYDKILVLTGEESEPLIQTGAYELLDVRNRREVAKNRMAGSIHIPLNMLHEEINRLDRDRQWLVYCAGGYRSMIAASILKSAGFHFVASIEGGMKAILEKVPQLAEVDME